MTHRGRLPSVVVRSRPRIWSQAEAAAWTARKDFSLLSKSRSARLNPPASLLPLLRLSNTADLKREPLRGHDRIYAQLPDTLAAMKPEAAARAILIDTNGFGRGLLSGGDISRIGQLVGNGVIVVVPDVVCHELASHVDDTVKSIRFDVLSAAGFGEYDALKNISGAGIYDGVVAALKGAGCSVRTSDPLWWQKGVVDQIRGFAPAVEKRGVRTGAADSIVASHALALAKEFETVLVITNDKELATHLSSQGVSTAENLQAAAGRVLENVSVSLLRDVLREVWGQVRWQTALTELVEDMFKPDRVQDVDVLGFSNVVGSGGQIFATTIFSFLHGGGMDDHKGGPDNVWSKGTRIYSVETKIDASSLLPVHLNNVEELADQYSYVDFPLPIDPEEFVRIEQSCITNPSVNATFRIERQVTSTATFSTVFVELDGEEVARVALSEVEYARTDRGYEWLDRHNGGIAVSGALVDVEAPGPITTPGYLGNRVMRLWAQNPS